MSRSIVEGVDPSTIDDEEEEEETFNPSTASNSLPDIRAVQVKDASATIKIKYIHNEIENI